ncbi:MAG TPA: TrkA C-terminal domain-containing protein, partial [Armatimonadota bacterium]|nr:TrkA C-terminal domain-containing protein [Armatimonadota bacterium]
DQLPIEIGMVTVSPGSPFAQRTIEEVGFGQVYHVTLLAVRRPGDALLANPRADLCIQADDELIIIGTQAQLDAIQTHTAAGEADAAARTPTDA